MNPLTCSHWAKTKWLSEHVAMLQDHNMLTLPNMYTQDRSVVGSTLDLFFCISSDSCRKFKDKIGIIQPSKCG